MTVAEHDLDIPSRPITRARKGPRIDWAHNPTETTPAQLRWFLLIPITMALLSAAVAFTSILATR